MKSLTVRAAVLASFLGAGAAVAQQFPGEAPLLTDHVALTSRADFLKAGEAYFNPQADWIIFQATPAPGPGEPAGEHYSMYVAKVMRNGLGAIIGLEEPILLSAPGSANTCGWFHPTQRDRVLYGSTLRPPTAEDAPGYQRDSGRYKWAFPAEMEIVTQTVPAIAGRTGEPSTPEPMFVRPDYDAEGSWSADGKFVLYSHVEMETSEPGRPDADVYVYDIQAGEHRKLVEAPGYDGGPFFSPCQNWIIYRSDRRGDNMLQLFASELERSADGAIVGIKREIALTDNEHVNWAPFFHPSGRFIVYGTSEVGHFNYEVFAIEWDPAKSPEQLRRERLTTTDGADVLPVFTPDGEWMMWTAQRGELGAGDQRPSSQIWAARIDAEAIFPAEQNGAGD